MGMRATTRDRLLDAAEALLFAEGAGAAPIDAITERAGISSATLYREYRTKEALLAAALDRRLDRWLAAWVDALGRATSDEERLLAVLDALEVAEGWGDARWCAFLGTSAAYGDDGPPELAAMTRRETDAYRERLVALARPIAADPAALAEALLLVVSGHLAMRLRDPGRNTTTARAVARAVVAAHRSSGDR